MRKQFLGAVLVWLLAAASVLAQQTTGNVTGRILDEQGAAVPGVAVTAKSRTTGFTRSETSDTEGVYRLTALPVGLYDVTAELQGFATVSKKDVEVNVSTKSGTNLFQGSFFGLFRDKSMNALTENETLSALKSGATPTKGDYRRNQFRGSFGGPIAKDRAHFFVAIERTQQDTTQVVNTQGLFPSKLVAQDRDGRPRARLQGGRELHQRAAPVHHVQHRQGRHLQRASHG